MNFDYQLNWILLTIIYKHDSRWNSYNLSGDNKSVCFIENKIKWILMVSQTKKGSELTCAFRERQTLNDCMLKENIINTHY